MTGYYGHQTNAIIIRIISQGIFVMLNENIKKLRKKAGLTQEKLAIKAGIPYTTLAKIEIGVIKKPSIQTVQKIASALDISIDYLVGNKR